MRTFEDKGFGRTVTQVELQKRLKPLGSSENLEFGFMGQSEDLETIISADNATLGKLGLTPQDYAQRIREIFLRIDDGHEDANGMSAQAIEYIHAPECPWGDFCSKSIFDYSQAVTEIILIDPKKEKEYQQLLLEQSINPKLLQRLWYRTRQVSRPTFYTELVKRDIGLILSDLQPHLIEEHNFFQGQQSPYRIDPERSRRFLGL